MHVLASLSRSYLVWVIERLYRLNLSVYDVNSVANVIHSVDCLHIKDGRNIISFDDMLL